MCAILANWGSAWGTWKAGLGVCDMGVNFPKGIIKNIVPIVMAGVLGIYGLIVSVIIVQAILPPDNTGYTTYSIYNGWAHVSAMSVEREETTGPFLLLMYLFRLLLFRSWLLDCAVDYLVWLLEERLV
jgi:ATP synthase proteolipid subunit